MSPGSAVNRAGKQGECGSSHRRGGILPAPVRALLVVTAHPDRTDLALLSPGDKLSSEGKWQHRENSHINMQLSKSPSAGNAQLQGMPEGVISLLENIFFVLFIG